MMANRPGTNGTRPATTQSNGVFLSFFFCKPELFLAGRRGAIDAGQLQAASGGVLNGYRGVWAWRALYGGQLARLAAASCIATAALCPRVAARCLGQRQLAGWDAGNAGVDGRAGGQCETE